MDDDALRLELYRLRIRLKFVERIALRSYVLGPVLAGVQTLEASLSGISLMIENNAKELELMCLSDPELSHLSDAQRALYADEWREMMDEMKAYIQEIGRDMRRIAKEKGK